MCNFLSLEEKIFYISKYKYNYFLNKSNVIGVGLGYKIKNGFNTFKKCLSVFVTRKLPCYNISSSNLVPSYYWGIPTDIVDTGVFHLQKLNNKIRPVPGGYDIGPAFIWDSGTLGCIVTDSKYYYILTCNHTITSKEFLRLNHPILQPSSVYGGRYREDTIATLSKFIPIKYSTSSEEGINYVDCAMAKITTRSQISTKINFLGRIKGMAKPSLGMSVQKVGATTELTKGNITSIGATIVFNEKQGKCIFFDQIITNKMSDFGDSGSILLDENINAIGMLMSGSPTKSTFNPIESVLNALDVKLVTS
ncbi:serine protease [Clostridium botulinum C]|uniref:Serine protease n=2 Tax=Clostridium botulinum TaxID=1491 RepID=A0A9Q4THX4_CLOBO|nr:MULTISPECIES: hypothetical protein [Clostridium]EGO89307.1 hypothetical protein CBCST_00395 [Clostridium botulinum C str. Stockholm]MCD3195296.1 serine protease [Clostridium botulinum C]MCD3200634.1 serine protease [Clostridium botulinum C]MCD3206042.1 serine protease [Clostridium botulinum C]MCD3208481.1 serine protease [Clostridium botulinum C]